MNVLFNTDKLTRLIANLQTFTGIRTNTFDAAGKRACQGAKKVI